MNIGLKIDEKLKEELTAIAKREDRSLSSVARIAIEKGLHFFAPGGIHHPPKKITRVESTLCKR